MKIVPVKSAPAALPAMELIVPVVASAASKRTELFRGCPSSGQTGKYHLPGQPPFYRLKKMTPAMFKKYTIEKLALLVLLILMSIRLGQVAYLLLMTNI